MAISSYRHSPDFGVETFYGLEDANLTNVDVMTDVSNPGTMFTRYTVAPTSSDRSRWELNYSIL